MEYNRDLIELGMPDEFHFITFRTVELKETSMEVREYRLEGETVVMVHALPEEEAQDEERLAHDAWTAAGRPVPLRFLWHSFESWGDSYWESVWELEGGGTPVVRSDRFVHVDDELQVTELMLRIEGR